MDFYYAMTNYHVICCILHKLLFNKNKACIHISSYLTNNQPNIINNIIESNIFDSVHKYDEIEFKKEEKKMNSSELNKEISRICKEVEKKIGKELSKATNIYICSDFYSLGVYLITNKINYYYFEDGCGVISKPIMPYRLIEKDNINRAAIVKKLKSFGENDYVNNRYANLSVQEKGYYNSKDIDFNVSELLKKLTKKQIKKILNIYEVKKINIKDKKAILLLTMHYNELFSIEEQKNIYKTLIDYFADDDEKIIIKPHPSDTIKEYDTVFKGSQTINRYMPSELFPYCIDKDFEKGLTCWSTSIFGLKSIIKNIINFDIRIDQTYVDFNKYYSIVEYLKCIKSDIIKQIVFKDINEIQFKRLLDKYFSNYNKYYSFEDTTKKDAIYIVNKMSKDLLDKKVISLTYSSDSKDIIFINKKGKNEENIFISVYNIDSDKKMDITKKLKYQNYELKISNLNEFEYKEKLLKIIRKKDEKITSTIKKYEKEKEQLESIIKEKDDYINKLYNSSSWKITKPIRAIADFIRK